MLSSAGTPFTLTLADPGIQGDEVTGMQGWGVRTPIAAEVAAATCGFVGVVHMRKGMMLVIGTLFMIVAAGCPPILTMLLGGTFSVDGAVPNVHVSIAPLLTSGGMPIPPQLLCASKI